MCVAAMTNAAAEQVFVDDQLMLNVYSQPDSSSERLATLRSGDAVERLETLDDFALVRLENGLEGWVGANYLTSEAPALVRLRTIEAEHKAATQKARKQFDEQIAKLEKHNAELQARIDALEKAAAAAEAEKSEPQPAPAPPPETTAPQSSEPSGSTLAWVWLPLILAAGGLGYFAGWQTLARRIRNRFGGLKIY